MDIAYALEILRGASPEELQSHLAQTVLTLQKVGQRLQVPILPAVANNVGESEQTDIEGGVSSVSASHLSSNCDPVSRSASEANPEKTPSPEDKLLKSLYNAVIHLWAKKDHKVSDIIKRKRPRARDRRVDDITRVEGDPNAPTEDKLLRTCAWISYASEFTKHQERKGDRVRVDYFVQLLLTEHVDSRSFREGKGGTIAKYVRGIDEFVGREQFFSLAIGHGVRLIVVKNLLEEKLHKRHLEVNCHAILLALGLAYSQVKSLTYKDLGRFVNLLLTEQALVSLPEESDVGSGTSSDVGSSPSHSRKRHILDVLQELSAWSKAFQSEYEHAVSRTATPESQPSAKRTCRNPQPPGYFPISPEYQASRGASLAGLSELSTAAASDSSYTGESVLSTNPRNDRFATGLCVSDSQSQTQETAINTSMDMVQHLDPLDITEMPAALTPADYPQIFTLPSVMIPADHPQLYPYQDPAVLTPAEYPQMFPFNIEQGTDLSNAQRVISARLPYSGPLSGVQQYILPPGIPVVQ